MTIRVIQTSNLFVGGKNPLCNLIQSAFHSAILFTRGLGLRAIWTLEKQCLCIFPNNKKTRRMCRRVFKIY